MAASATAASIPVTAMYVTGSLPVIPTRKWPVTCPSMIAMTMPSAMPAATAVMPWRNTRPRTARRGDPSGAVHESRRTQHAHHQFFTGSGSWILLLQFFARFCKRLRSQFRSNFWPRSRQQESRVRLWIRIKFAARRAHLGSHAKRNVGLHVNQRRNTDEAFRTDANNRYRVAVQKSGLPTTDGSPPKRCFQYR